METGRVYEPNPNAMWRLKLLTYAISLLTIVWLLIFLPVWLLYAALLCVTAWFAWTRPGRDIIVVHSNTKRSEEWMSRILPLIDRRAVVLNYDDRKGWNRWSLPVQLFRCFGPQPTAEIFLPQSLPAVIVLRKFRLPRTFTFGRLSQEHASEVQELGSYLARD